MASDTEQQEVDKALMEESLGIPPTDQKAKKKNPQRRSPVNYIITYGIPIVIVVLIIIAFIIAFVAIRKYNRNCKHEKAGSCRGVKWFFT